jgi:hypothetical protein
MNYRPEPTKINQVLQKLPKSVVATSDWLNTYGLDKRSAYQYLKTHWFESLGIGAYKRYGDLITWQGALHAIQNQLDLDIHVGAKTALELQGKAHNIGFRINKTFLFTSTKANLPKWFKAQKWQANIELVKTQFLEPDTALKELDMGNFKLQISSSERAILEALYLVPKTQDFQECYYLMENLMDMRPKVLQSLLEGCKSIKVKRLFLFMAEKAKLPILNKLNISRIDLGSGKRVIVPGGKFDPVYKITYPKKFQVNE